MNLKQLGPLLGLAGTIAGAGTGAYKLTSDVIRSKLVTRDEYVEAANERKVAEAAHSAQLAGWQATLNQVQESNAELARKIDTMLLMLAGKATAR